MTQRDKASRERALRAWAADLAAWRIPEEILTSARESPWALPTELFTKRAERYVARPEGPSYELAWQALGESGGTVIDVGAGGGAASLPLAARLSALTAVDTQLPMLERLRERAAALGVAVRPVRGQWPDIAGEIEVADVVVCHHVFYNVPELEPFVEALTAHARRLVVVELTQRHPMSNLNPYWEEFHGLTRPRRPTAEDAIGVLRALGLEVMVRRWERTPTTEEMNFDALVEFTRRRLCLPPERAGEVAAALRRDGAGTQATRELVTVAWRGQAGYRP